MYPYKLPILKAYPTSGDLEFGNKKKNKTKNLLHPPEDEGKTIQLDTGIWLSYL